MGAGFFFGFDRSNGDSSNTPKKPTREIPQIPEILSETDDWDDAKTVRSSTQSYLNLKEEASLDNSHQTSESTKAMKDSEDTCQGMLDTPSEEHPGLSENTAELVSTEDKECTIIIQTPEKLAVEEDEESLLRSARQEEYETGNILLFSLDNHTFALPRRDMIFHSAFLHSMDLGKSTSPELSDMMSGKKAIAVHKIEMSVFRCILHMIYPELNYMSKRHEINLSEWISMLQLAKIWQMQYLKQMIITQMGPLIINKDHSLCIALGTEYSIDYWVWCGVQNMIIREAAMSKEDVDELGIDIVLKISSLRERLKWTIVDEQHRLYVWTFRNGRQDDSEIKDASAVICKLFGLKLTMEMEARSLSKSIYVKVTR